MKSAVFDLHIVNGPEGSYTFMLTSGPEFRSPLHFHTPTLVALLLVCSLQSLLEIGGSRTCRRLKTENLQRTSSRWSRQQFGRTKRLPSSSPASATNDHLTTRHLANKRYCSSAAMPSCSGKTEADNRDL